ncbi:uncharacterized protein LOC127625419 isoform X2 [Xyrauchen texanus]|uniref:uncharacterized protein LOC127625419 isoform X2 n=1 Tax=Xyrauchen texanus TaxID=154827 RepID=UPI0022419A4A|nr:uncharacterized protein LOC127625419 isoform X2 [Xyrauchen texanus]
MFDVLVMFSLLFTCLPGDGDDVVLIKVSDGDNLTLSTQIANPDDDPQVLFILQKEISDELIAQLVCHHRKCEAEGLKSGVLLHYDEQNVTLILLNVNRSQEGLYKVCSLSGKLSENRIYNVSVFDRPPCTVSPLTPSPMLSKSFPVGVTTAVAVAIFGVLLISVIIAVLYRKHKNRHIYEGPVEMTNT